MNADHLAQLQKTINSYIANFNDDNFFLSELDLGNVYTSLRPNDASLTSINHGLWSKWCSEASIYAEEKDPLNPGPPPAAPAFVAVAPYEAAAETDAFIALQEGAAARDAIRRERLASNWRADPSLTTGGRGRDALRDDLTIEYEGRFYCIACDASRVASNPVDHKNHAYKCSALTKKYPILAKEVAEWQQSRSYAGKMASGAALPAVRGPSSPNMILSAF